MASLPIRDVRVLLSAVLLTCLACSSQDGEGVAPQIQNVDPHAAAELLKKEPSMVVLDIRTPEEFASGHLSGAIGLDFRASDFADRLAKLDREQGYLLY